MQWSSKKGLSFGMCFLLLLAAAGHVSLSYYRNGLAQYKAEIMQVHRNLAGKVDQLHVELTSLSRPERLRKLARTQLGMAPPSPLQVLHP
ncbi:MAG: cell division protein FtsL [Mariprofundaceae bacterium]